MPISILGGGGAGGGGGFGSGLKVGTELSNDVNVATALAYVDSTLAVPTDDWMWVNFGASAESGGADQYVSGQWLLVRVADLPVGTKTGSALDAASATNGLIFPDALGTGEDAYLAEHPDNGTILFSSSSASADALPLKIVPLGSITASTARFVRVADKAAAEAKPDNDGNFYWWPAPDDG